MLLNVILRGTMLFVALFVGVFTLPSANAAAPQGPEMSVVTCHTYEDGKTSCYTDTRRMLLEYNFVESIKLNSGYEANMTISAREVWKACKIVTIDRMPVRVLKSNANICKFVSGDKVSYRVPSIGYDAYLYFVSANAKDFAALPKGYIAEQPAISACAAEPCTVSKAMQDSHCASRGYGPSVLEADRLDRRGSNGFEGVEAPIGFKFIDDASREALKNMPTDSSRFERASAVWMLHLSADSFFK